MLLYSYNPGSQGGAALSQTLGIKRAKHVGRPIRDRVILNWGASQPSPRFQRCTIINPFPSVNLAADKLGFFRAMDGHDIVPWFTTNREEAAQKIRDTGHAIVCRTILRGHSGAGIVIANTPEELVNAPMYVEYKKKKEEYRVHVFDKEVIDIQKKARVKDFPNPNWQVRNLAGGFIYARNDINPPPEVSDIALKAMNRIPGLNFGAVDVIHGGAGKRAWVLEINTAPGLEGQTVTKYADAIRRNYL